ncbi:MAG: hypothetical protein LQ341_007686, partial [Variospora aurantia]
SPVQARTGKQKLSNRARRTQKQINIINATFARCVGKPVSDKYKGLAYPVYRSAGNVKYVLATHSDLRIVKILQHRTEADQADIRLTKIKTPSHPSPQTCIAVVSLNLVLMHLYARKMWNLTARFMFRMRGSLL